MEIKRLTPELCSLIRADAFVSLYGDESCDLSNMQTSCFASEACAYRFQPSDLDVLMYSALPYVAVCTKTDGGVDFCACVAADRCRDEHVAPFGNIPLEDDALYIHTLCVDERHRKENIATALLNEIKRMKVPLYLHVVTGHGTPYEELVKKRCESLITFYTKRMNFRQIGATPQRHLFKWYPTA